MRQLVSKMCFVHVLFLQNHACRMAAWLKIWFGSPIGISLDLRAFAIVRRLAASRKRSVVFLLIGTRRWAAGRRGALVFTFFNLFPNLPKLDLH